MYAPRAVRRWLVILFVLAAALRVGWVAARFGPSGRAEHLDYPDEEVYVLSGRSLAAGGGLIDEFGYRATYMPGYPAFIAVFQRLRRPLLWTRIAQAILAAWVAPATFLLARQFLAVMAQQPAARVPDSGRDREGADPRLDERPLPDGRGSESAPILAGLAAAFDPFLLFFSGLLLTEALFSVVVVTAWLFVLPMGGGRPAVRDAALWGCLAGIGICLGLMLRPSAAVLLMAVPLLVVLVRRFDRTSIAFSVVLVAVTLAGLLPWALRNQVVLGEWRWLTTRGGISLYDGVQPGATGGSDLAHTKTAAAAQGLGEVEWDRHFQQAAIAEVRRDPVRVLKLAGLKFLRTWSLTPNEASYRRGAAAMVSAVWMVLVLGFAAIGWWRFHRHVAAWVLLLLPVAAFTALHMVYVGSVRYRVPQMPFVMVLSGIGVWSVLSMARRRLQHGPWVRAG